MKKTIIAILQLQLVTLTLPAAALPEDWEVDLAAKQPQVFTLQRPRGETYELKAVLKRHGKPFEPAITNACIYWQTNGMENLYWSAPASVSNNVLRATWLPSMDPGATTVRGYIGDPGHIYAAAFQFRFIASPGALPNALPLPTPVIDFARVRVLNPPWGSGGGGGGGCDTNAVDALANSAVVTNALTIATTNRVAALETATNNLSSSVVSSLQSSVSGLASSVSSLESSKADKAEISATNPTFSNEVAAVARTVTPPPSPTLRLFDEVRQCYWIGRMINGVINWEVE